MIALTTGEVELKSLSHWGMFQTPCVFFSVPAGFRIDPINAELLRREWNKPGSFIPMTQT